MRTVVVLIACTVMFCGIACTPQNASPTISDPHAQAEKARNISLFHTLLETLNLINRTPQNAPPTDPETLAQAERAANEARFQNLLGILGLNRSSFGGGFSDVPDQCESAENKSENFDLMMNRAKETVFWLSSSLIKDILYNVSKLIFLRLWKFGFISVAISDL